MTNLEKGDLAKAEAALTDGAGAASAGRDVFYSLGEVKFAQGRGGEVVPEGRRGRSRLAKLDIVAVAANDRDTAIKYMEKVVAMDAASPEAAQAKAAIEQIKK